jgi:hypothetical protein
MRVNALAPAASALWQRPRTIDPPPRPYDAQPECAC